MPPREMDVYGTVKVGERGQVVIPSDAREKLGIRAGDILLVISTPHNDGIAMIRADIVKNLIQKMNVGLSQMDDGTRRKPSDKGR